MDQHNEGFPSNNMFADSQQYNAFDSMNFLNGNEPAFQNPTWPVPEYQQSRANVPSYGLPQNGSHLATTSTHANFNGQTSPPPYERSINHSPAPFNQNAFANYGGPQNFQYRQPQQYDPSLNQTVGNGQAFSNSGTIAPQALEHETSPYGNPYAGSNYAQNNFGQPHPNRPVPVQQRPVDQRALVAAIPKGVDAGMFSIIKYDELCRTTQSERMGNFVNVGKEPLEWDVTRSAVPTYAPRKSRNELRALAGNDPGLLAKIGKKSMKNKAYPSKGIRSASGANSVSSPQIKYEQESSTDDSSDDDSAYSDDDDDLDTPLPDKRPEDSKGAVEYDTIKALWRSKRKTLEGSVIRKSLVDFWEVVKTIRDRWKADAAAVTEAEEKKRLSELPLLKSRVKDQRDMVEAAFRAALRHGHPDIVALLAENVSLIYVCYQFLLDCFKNDEVNGGVSKAILETMSKFTTLTDFKMEKVNLTKILPRYQKKGDARVQYWVKGILANVKVATKEAALKDEQKKTDTSSVQNPAKPASPPTKRTVPEPVAGVKRPATATPGEGTAPKKNATGSNKTNVIAPTAKVNGVAKKPASASESKSAPPSGTVAAVRKTVTARPSGNFLGLQSASKKPGTSIADRTATTVSKPVTVSKSVNKPAATATATAKPAFSFAETMANLAKPKEEKPSSKPQKEEKQESVEERKTRLHKEARRKLRVRFAERDQLEQIRYFQSDPNEELGHDSSQLRDMSDVGGEGRMLKQHQNMMELDDEDDEADEAEKVIDWHTPSLIDFSVVPADERARNFAPYGGGELQPDTPERAARETYENNTLLVFYANPSEIPPNPREPADADKGEIGGEIKQFGAPDEKFASRARVMRAKQLARQPQYSQQSNGNGYNAPPGLMNIQPPQHHMQQAAPDIQSILASLQAQGQNAQPQQPGPSMHQPYMNGQSANNFQAGPVPPQVPPANIDLAAILASIKPQQQQQTGYNASVAPTMSFPPQAQQQQAPMFTGANINFAAGDPAQNPYYKTKVCRFFQEGRCTKGDKCSYLHEAA